MSYPVTTIILRANSPIRGQEEGPWRRIDTIQPEGSAERDISSALLVRRLFSSATYPQPRRAVLPDERWRFYESPAPTAGHPAYDRGIGRFANPRDVAGSVTELLKMFYFFPTPTTVSGFYHTGTRYNNYGSFVYLGAIYT